MKLLSGVASVLVVFIGYVNAKFEIVEDSNVVVPTCQMSLEMMFVQDFSSSFADDLNTLNSVLTLLYTQLESAYPNSRFGFSTFVDKPQIGTGANLPIGGILTEWCLNITDAISAGSNQSKVQTMFEGYIGSGGDLAENQIGAVFDLAMRDEAATGLTDRVTDEHGNKVTRVFVLSTDATFHMAGEVGGLVANDGDGITDCETEDYPTIAQLKAALDAKNIYLVVLASGSLVIDSYVELLTTIGNSGAVYNLYNNAANIIGELDVALKAIEDDICTMCTDTVFVQDVTTSYKNDMPSFTHNMEALVNKMSNAFADPRFGLVSFADKPLLGFGDGPSGDYCYKVHQTLSLDKDLTIVASRTVKTVSGLDWPESQLDGMISAVVDSEMGWRSGNITPAGQDLVRMIALATDSFYHVAHHSAMLNLKPHSQGMVDCTGEHYPNVEDLGLVLERHDVCVLFVTTPDIYRHYKKLCTRLTDEFGVYCKVVELKDLDDVAAVVTSNARLLADEVVRHRRM